MSVLTVAYAGIDNVVDAVAAWLSGPQFAKALNDVRNARGDGIDLPAPAVVIKADIDPKTLTQFPAILVIGGDAPSTGTGQQPTGMDVAVLIVVFLNGDEPTVLATQMWRYLRAVRLCFERTQTFFPLLPWAPSRLGTMSPDPTRGPVNGLTSRYLKAGTFDLVVPIESDS